eukprot:TRINITY_DN3738_c0_g1_i1.p1 TRINITY_DN3738_c0_g1~~TRINITY_DN3738_c0_g1_i1.p1  ORF type:complete len:344 (+),score=82.16 TRINITY_DN3738_c0_g1_i1:33-1034(+)
MAAFYKPFSLLFAARDSPGLSLSSHVMPTSSSSESLARVQTRTIRRFPKVPAFCSRLSSADPYYSKKQRFVTLSAAAGLEAEAEAEEPVEQPPAEEVQSVASEVVDEDAKQREELKEALLDTFYGTERGFRASSETRAEVSELIVQLEAKNPTAFPTEASDLLDGTWTLAYTSLTELTPLLALSSLPLLTVGPITQTINSFLSTVVNSISFSSPAGSVTVGVSASFEVRSPYRLQVKFEEGTFSPPQITAAGVSLPEEVEVLGQKLSLQTLQTSLKPLEEAAIEIAKLVSGAPTLKFSIDSSRAQSWLLTTYLDKNLRIARGDAGSFFVLVKE